MLNVTASSKRTTSAIAQWVSRVFNITRNSQASNMYLDTDITINGEAVVSIAFDSKYSETTLTKEIVRFVGSERIRGVIRIPLNIPTMTMYQITVKFYEDSNIPLNTSKFEIYHLKVKNRTETDSEGIVLYSIILLCIHDVVIQ